MARYAKTSADVEFGMLVKWQGTVYGVWDNKPHNQVSLVPCNTMASTLYESTDESALVTVPLRQIEIPEPIHPDSEMQRALFRLDIMPWDLVRESKFPFSTAMQRCAYTDDDLLTLISQLDKFDNPYIETAWRTTFAETDDGVRKVVHPGITESGLRLAFLARLFFHALSMYEIKDVRQDLYMLRDCCLKPEEKTLCQIELPDWAKPEMLKFLDKYAKDNAVTDEMRSYYQRLLDEVYAIGDKGGIKQYAYAYYGGNAFVPCDWHKAEQALLKLFNPDVDPHKGDIYAANSLGYIYGSKRLGNPDYAKAFLCFQYGADNFLIESTYKLSDMYRLGLGVKQNSVKAWELISKLYSTVKGHQAANNKYADIVLRMGYCYRDGIWVRADKRRAYEFFMEAQRAIDARRRRGGSYGDDKVARNISIALESVKNTEST